MGRLEKLTDDYLLFMVENGWADRAVATHERILRYFKSFASERRFPSDRAVLPENRSAFLDRCKLTKAHGVMVGFSRWLEETGLVEKPPGGKDARLPDVCEQYIV